MSIGITKLFEESASLVDQGRLIPAVECLREACRLTEFPDRRAWAVYNIGTIHFQMLGDGEAARREFLESAGEFDAHGYGQHQQLRIVHADALENAMLCALSFDEFESLATRLQGLTPGTPIVVELVPQVREARERGTPWSDELFDFAGRCYDRNDPKLDKGRYGQAKSTYHLLLTHRRELRLSRADWRLAVLEYCLLSIRMATDCMKARGFDGDPNSPEEFLPILTEAMPLVDEYLAMNSGDEDLRKFRGNMEEIVNAVRQRWADLNERSEAVAPTTQYQVCQKCGHVYARRDVDGPQFAVDEMNAYDRTTMCTKCGGNVVWQSSSEVENKAGQGCFPSLLLLIVVVALAVLSLR